MPINEADFNKKIYFIDRFTIRSRMVKDDPRSVYSYSYIWRDAANRRHECWISRMDAFETVDDAVKAFRQRIANDIEKLEADLAFRKDLLKSGPNVINAEVLA